jgi:RNA polymerase sigma factor (sigma-70 family)
VTSSALRLEPSRGVAMAGGDPLRDEELLMRVGSGDEHAFRELFSRYAAIANALAFRLIRQAHLAEEIVQEAFLAVWRHPDRYDRARGSVRAWVLGTVHHRAVDLVRREQAQRRRAEDSAGTRAVLEDPADEVAAAVDRPRERERVRRALDELPPDQADVIRMMYFDGLTQTRIAERTGLPLGTVKSRTLLGMRRLRGLLEDDER